MAELRIKNEYLPGAKGFPGIFISKNKAKDEKEGYSMIFDGHSDIFSDVRYKREAGETQVLKNHHLDRLRKGGIGGACFVIWADTYNGHAPKDEMEAIVKGIKGEMAETKEFVLIHNVEELKAAEAAGKFAILLGIEGLAGIGEDLSKIDELYDLGARHAMLTWNEENALATV